MSGLFKKPSVHDREMDRIQRRVSPLEGGTPYLDQLWKPSRRERDQGADRKGASKPGASGACRRSRWSFFDMRDWRDFWPDVFGGADNRLKDYLSGSFETARPVRYQRRVRRNRLIVTAVFLGVILVWALGRWG